MIDYTEKIQQISKTILAEGRVDVVVGYKKGSLPGTNEPCAVSDPAKTDLLIWDSCCRLNLANYITGRKDKVAIIAKGCDSRNINNHIIEKRINRDQLFIIGVPCTGMIDKKKLFETSEEEVLSIIESENEIVLVSANSEKTYKRKELLQSNCLTCTHKNPVIFDEMIADTVKENKDISKYEDVESIEAMSPDEKWDFFDDIFSECTRCYACRNACPLCYCPTCFVDESTPQWVGKGDDPVDVRTFHTLRAFHCAGRCTDCGACEAACPMGIKIRLFTKKLNKSCEELYGYEAGLSLDERPALDKFSLDDPEAFIK